MLGQVAADEDGEVNLGARLPRPDRVVRPRRVDDHVEVLTAFCWTHVRLVAECTTNAPTSLERPSTWKPAKSVESCSGMLRGGPLAG
jgi:hypothetical protein